MPHQPNDKTGFLGKLREISESNITNEQFGVNELAREMGMSRSNLHRRVKSATGGSVSRFISRVRLEKAKLLLRETDSTISEIAFETGFHSVPYFTRCFKDHFGIPPGESRKHIQNDGSPDGPEALEEQEESSGIIKKKVPVIYFYTAISILMVVAVIFGIWSPLGQRRGPQDKSIAVLPFINDGPEETDPYFINGTMEAILHNLSRIEDLRVVSRTSVEQYRKNPRPAPVVAKEMNVSYIVEGSGQLLGDRLWLSIQLIDAINDRHVWSGNYNRSLDEIFEMQSQIAQLVAGEVKAVISPEEKALMEKIPTQNPTAYDLFLKARETQNKDQTTGEDLLRLCLEFDSTFAMAYVFLGWFYLNKYELGNRIQSECLDSVRKFVQMALFYDDQLDGAFHLRGYYHRMVGESEKAYADFNRTLELNPNSAGAYIGLAWLGWVTNDLFGAIRNFHRAIALEKGFNMISNYRYLGQAYFMAGFREQSEQYYRKALELDGDSAEYRLFMAVNESYFNTPSEQALELLEEGYRADSTNMGILYRLGNHYANIGRDDRAMEYFDKYLNHFNHFREIPVFNLLGLALPYWRIGRTETADSLLDQLIHTLENSLSSGDVETGSYGSLARAYAIKGEKEKAYEYLRVLNDRSEFITIYQTNLRAGSNSYIPELEDDEEYRQIQQEFNDKFLLQQNQIRQWLEEQEML